MAEKIRYVRCDRCGRPIVEGSECIKDRMKAGIYCSVLCWAYSQGDFREVTLDEEAAEDSYLELIDSTVPVKKTKYSNVEVCDANEDEEMEKLAEIMGFAYKNYKGFKRGLDNNFVPQVAEKEIGLNKREELDFVEWCACTTAPNNSVSFNAGCQVSLLAYEFANGFMIFEHEESF